MLGLTLLVWEHKGSLWITVFFMRGRFEGSRWPLLLSTNPPNIFLPNHHEWMITSATISLLILKGQTPHRSYPNVSYLWARKQETT